MSEPSIYSYINPISYLKDVLQTKQKRNQRFSLRSWSRDLKINEPTILSQILNGKRPIPLHYVEKFSKNLKLEKGEAEYLEAIVEAHVAKTPTHKKNWLKKAQKLFLQASFEADEIEDFRFYADPLHLTILTLVDTLHFNEDPKWIKDNLAQKYSTAEVKESLELLEKQKLIARDKSGRLKRTSVHLSTKQDVASLWVKKFHEVSLKQAAEAIYQQNVEDREYGSYMLSIRLSDLPEIKEKVREFTTDILAQYAMSDGSADSVYQLNVNFIGRTNKVVS